MNPDRVHREAYDEFLDAVRYYNTQSQGLGEEFANAIESAIDVID